VGLEVCRVDGAAKGVDSRRVQFLLRVQSLWVQRKLLRESVSAAEPAKPPKGLPERSGFLLGAGELRQPPASKEARMNKLLRNYI